DTYDAQQVIAFEDRHPKHCPHRLEGLRLVRVFRIGRDIRIVDRSAFERSSTSNAVPIEANWIVLYEVLEFLRSVEGRRQPQQLTIKTVNERSISPAQLHGTFGHGLKDRVQIKGGATDDIEYLRRGSLLFQRLGEFARASLLRLKQACVLDGNYRLVGEGLDQLDLFLGERPNLGSVQKKNANRNPL